MSGPRADDCTIYEKDVNSTVVYSGEVSRLESLTAINFTVTVMLCIVTKE